MGKRKAYTPFSTSSEAGVTAAPVEGYILVDQEVRPTIDTGFVDSKGQWIGHQTSDTAFDIYQKDEAIANSGTILTPSPNPDGTWPLDMTGFRDIQIAIKPSNGGNYALCSVMGPDSISFANLNPVNAASEILIKDQRTASASLQPAFDDDAQALTVDVWNIFMIQFVLANQKLLQFKITNNSGDVSTIETAFMRVV
jgi:hypothetical protein